MPSIEERLQALEQEHSQLKKTIELQTIAIRALVSKEAFEKLQEQSNRLFDALMAHDRLTNERLGDIQNQIIELDNKLDGKIVGLQTEMRQRFNEQDGKIVGLQTEMRQRFNEQDSEIASLQTTQEERLNKIDATLEQHTTLFAEILARLPKQQPE